ncbi:hypothetical protein Sbal117_4047 [Shewanella baltica OS117]|nr:hypothetical protein Sbal117_4047 [Shewanella baltica OS117]
MSKFILLIKIKIKNKYFDIHRQVLRWRAKFGRLSCKLKSILAYYLFRVIGLSK